ncbi:ECF transporter S component [Anaerococcus hydrogenalis]|uniref:Riboflavin transporter n=1 Tax=Anaerococcus hydrogenalis TaxID=33029 RepID=A0A2N6UIY4_9FIRM|nr:ECF transporter S component [Anaerococcus hydrogenalis]MBS5989444.1 ECF transporter S component [Anaerococcus hydrogenalis]MDK7694988.1 ECF transporter S component [Anaerococcus hydrogenalis]MDK7696458.1 ECF transporter S component [Anaerococcus hydrogenalis]MDK7708015.1 ECF transporter S component [Anaerococcus hydrogenalis]PMC81618.1 ECF transporter S component [Anaerococcus hydrogenalis]
MSHDQKKLRNLVKVGILSAMSFILMFVQFPIPVAPPFMKVDLADVPALIGGFSMGPVYGVLIQLIKNVLNLTKTSTGGVGEISNFIVGGLFVFISASIYKKNKTKKNATIAMVCGVLVMTLAATFSNAFVIFPLYGKAMGVDMSAFVAMAHKTNALVNSYFTMMLFAIVPFNLIKGFLEVLVTKLLYKHVSSILHDRR